MRHVILHGADQHILIIKGVNTIMTTKTYIIQAYNGIEVIDDRLQAEEFIYALDRLEKKYKRKKTYKNRLIKSIIKRIVK